MTALLESNFVLESLLDFVKTSGFGAFFAEGGWKFVVMIALACFLLYLAIKKQFEPLLLLPIAFGMLLTNLPGADMFHPTLFDEGQIDWYDLYKTGGLLDYLYLGVKLGIYPCLIFIGVGAMTDFGPLIANPKSFLLGAALSVVRMVRHLSLLPLASLQSSLVLSLLLLTLIWHLCLLSSHQLCVR